MAISISLPPVSLSFAPVDFDSVADDLAMNPGGIYAFYGDKEQCLYVGQSKTLTSRLRSHFAASSFSKEAVRIDIYFVSDPYDREVYETHAITALGGIYNRAKSWRRRAASPLIPGDIEDIDCEIYALRIEQDAVRQEYRDIDSILHPPVPRKRNNRRGGDLSRAYIDYINEQMREMDDESTAGLECEHRHLRERLGEIDAEIENLRKKRGDLVRKLVV